MNNIFKMAADLRNSPPFFYADRTNLLKIPHLFQFLDIIKEKQLGVSSGILHQTFFRSKGTYQ
ncbi:hypothetical protein PBF_09542 [Cytobacillus firmus DS1]|uniref:Uncharacterized protein n=1 Tax=Cytobacillus firmus DS1 TaxID=1307436 RepID=W7L7K6_CYTFI|nr:hypothetical protein PBF_09542 [Cytobacillus firmus DS1]